MLDKLNDDLVKELMTLKRNKLEILDALELSEDNNDLILIALYEERLEFIDFKINTFNAFSDMALHEYHTGKSNISNYDLINELYS